MNDQDELSEELKQLIIQYMVASNEGQHATAEGLLHKIQQYNKQHGLS